MRVAARRVVDRKVVVEGEQKQALCLAIAEADPGEGVEADAFLEQPARDA